MNFNIVALHGFLGAPTDFELLRINLKNRLKNDSSEKMNWILPHYYKIEELNPKVPWSEWPQQFKKFLKDQPLDPGRKVLLGYSQGGRLALEFLKQYGSETTFNALILISAGLGIEDHEKPARLLQDNHWAKRFLNEPFSSVVKDWNAQAVFTGSKAEPNRKESDYDKDLLAANLKNWSVAQHSNYKELLKNLKIPVCYISGELDHKYSSYGEKLSLANQQIEFYKIPQAGHRCFLDQPEIVGEKIYKFLQRI